MRNARIRFRRIDGHDQYRDAGVVQLDLDADRQEAALPATGLELVGRARISRVAGSGAPTDVVLTDSPQAHCLLLSFKRPPGAGQTLTRYPTDATLDPKYWQVQVGGAREQTLGPFVKGTEVLALVTALWPTTTEPEYAAVVSRIVQ